MSQQQRVVVVGAGVLGLFTALELARDGQVEVTVIEAGHPGSGSSARSVGMVETQYMSKPDIAVRAFGRETYNILEREHNLTFTHGGYLRIGRSSTDVTRFGESVKLQAEMGILDAEVLDVADIAARWPHLNTDGMTGGLYGAWDGYADGYEICQLLTKLVRENGGQVITSARLFGAMRRNVWQLTTTHGTLDADVVVNAAGGWGGVVANKLATPVELVPQLHGALIIELPEAKPFTPFVMDYVPGAAEEGVYFRSERADQLIAGLHTEEVTADAVSPDIHFGGLDFDTIERIGTMVSERLRDIDDIFIGRSWTGIYPMSPDHRPIVGAHPKDPTVVCALGGGGNGIQLGPAIGRVAADAVLGRTGMFAPDVDWNPARPSVLSSLEVEA